MQNAIKVEIKRLAKRAFAKEKKSEEIDQKYRDRFVKRTGVATNPPRKKEPSLKLKHFDPAYCARNANFLSKTLWHKILENKYDPIPAIKYGIPKPDGSKREIMAFSIPDAAVANIILRRTMKRNLKRLSPSSYAYHPDKNVFDAILTLRNFEHDGKLFAIQIDFEKYFDTIPTGYLFGKINDAAKISLTPHEKNVFRAFLYHKSASYEEYATGNFQKRHRGTPQGSSVSLLLANLANHDLDTALASESGQFVRFADDVVAVCKNYEQAQKLEQCFRDHCETSGLKINEIKSPGVAIISNRKQELRTYSHFDYLGYRFSSDGLSVPEKTTLKLKSRISRLINIYLLQYLTNGYNPNRAAVEPYKYDWDLLGLISEIRRSLYGGLSEHDLYHFIYEGKRLNRMKGLMGFYCLLDNSDELKKIDGWMLSAVRRAMVKRHAILNSKYSQNCPRPTNSELATGEWLDQEAWRGNPKPDARMPSMVRGWRAARKHYFTFGLEQVQAPGYARYSSIATFFDY